MCLPHSSLPIFLSSIQKTTKPSILIASFSAGSKHKEHKPIKISLSLPKNTMRKKRHTRTFLRTQGSAKKRNMLKAPSRKDRNSKHDPHFAAKLAIAVARIAKVNTRIHRILSLHHSSSASKRIQQQQPPEQKHHTRGPIHEPFNRATTSNEDILATTLLSAFERSASFSGGQATSQHLRNKTSTIRHLSQTKRARAREQARERFKGMYREYVRRTWPLNWEQVLKQE